MKIKHLMFSKKYWDKLIKGEKTVTVRLGDAGLKPGDQAFVHCGGYVIGRVRILSVRRKRLKDLTEEEVKADGFSSLDELVKALKEHYSRVGMRSVVSVIRFEWIEKFDAPIFSERFAWDVDLTSDQVAKLALEKLRGLSDEERVILGLVAREGSIRRAAARLGGMRARPLIRGVLRRALEELKKEGYI